MSELRFQLGDRVRISGTAIKTHTGYSPLKTLFRDGPVPVKRDAWLKSTSLTEGVIVGYRTVTDGITHYDSDGGCFVPTKGTSRRVWLVAIDLRRNPVMAFDAQLEKAADGNAEDAIARVREAHQPMPTYTEECEEYDSDAGCERPHVESADGCEHYHLDGPTTPVCSVCSYVVDDGWNLLANIPFPCPTVRALDGE